MKRVLVTGAFGLIGRAVVATLHAHGVAVTALTNVRQADTAGVDRVVFGDAGDVDVVRSALADVTAVVHLAALASPLLGSAVDVFAGNTRATFVVLDEAARAGVRRAVIASSYSVLGLPFAPRTVHPPYFPLDADTPLQIEDCYALAKQADEATADMMARRHGMAVVALRFPFVGDDARIAERLRRTIADPGGQPAREAWAYLDVRDAAEAVRLGLVADLTGVHRLFLAAPEILAPYPTEELIRAHHPDSEIRRPLPGRTTPIDTEPAARVLGFAARHVVAVPAL